MNFSLAFDVADWFYWGDNYYDTNTPLNKPEDMRDIHKPIADLSAIPAIQRRRLPEVAKRMHHFAKRLADEQTPIIYASYNGQVSQTLAIIRSFAADVSPAKFSVSVHNAIAGLLSVIHKNTLSYQAIDSLSGLIESAIVEAAGLLTKHEKVGIIYYDETLPTELAVHNEEIPAMRVFALTICRGNHYCLAKIPTLKKHHPDNMLAEFDAPEQIASFFYNKEKILVNQYANTAWQWSCNVS